MCTCKHNPDGVAAGKGVGSAPPVFPRFVHLVTTLGARGDGAPWGAAAAAVARFIAGGALRRSSAALASFGFRPASSAAASADERRAPESLLGMGETALTRLARDMGQPSYRGKQMHDAIYNMRKYSVDDMTRLPGPFRAQLTAAGVVVGRQAPVEVVSSPDGTKKVLIELHCGSIIEAVGIPEEMEEARAAANAAEGFPLYEDGDELEDSDALEDAFGG